jgi:hypothetical protein
VRLALENPRLQEAHDRALVLWLVGTHHGLGRPFFDVRDPANEGDATALLDLPQVYAGNKEGTQHGANRLAAVGLAVLTVVPRERSGEVRLSTLGGARSDGGFALRWPIWRDAMSLSAVRALLARGDLQQGIVRQRLAVDRVLALRHIIVGKFMNFTVAREVGAADPT